LIKITEQHIIQPARDKALACWSSERKCFEQHCVLGDHIDEEEKLAYYENYRRISSAIAAAELPTELCGDCLNDFIEDNHIDSMAVRESHVHRDRTQKWLAKIGNPTKRLTRCDDFLQRAQLPSPS